METRGVIAWLWADLPDAGGRDGRNRRRKCTGSPPGRKILSFRAPWRSARHPGPPSPAPKVAAIISRLRRRVEHRQVENAQEARLGVPLPKGVEGRLGHEPQLDAGGGEGLRPVEGAPAGEVPVGGRPEPPAEGQDPLLGAGVSGLARRGVLELGGEAPLRGQAEVVAEAPQERQEQVEEPVVAAPEGIEEGEDRVVERRVAVGVAQGPAERLARTAAGRRPPRPGSRSPGAPCAPAPGASATPPRSRPGSGCG